MPQSIGTVSAMDAKVLVGYSANTLPFHICSTRLGDFNAGSVEFRFADAVGESTARSAETDAYNSADLTTTVRQITVAEVVNQIALTTSEYNLQPDDLLEKVGLGNIAQVGLKTQDKMFDIITSSNFSNVTTVANSAWNYDKLVDMRKLCNDKKWKGPRALVLPTEAVAYLRKDSTFKSQVGYAVAQSLSGEVDRPDSWVGYVEGFNIFESASLPSASGSDFHGFMCTPDAIGFGIVPVKDDSVAVPYQVSSVTIPSQNFSIRQEKGILANNNVKFLRHIQFNGFAKGNTDALYRIKTA